MAKLLLSVAEFDEDFLNHGRVSVWRTVLTLAFDLYLRS